MLFSIVTLLYEGRIIEALRTLEVEKSRICLVGTRRPTVSIIEHHLILSLKTLTKIKLSDIVWNKVF
jgi:hypothetical protein